MWLGVCLGPNWAATEEQMHPPLAADPQGNALLLGWVRSVVLRQVKCGPGR